MTKKFKYEYTLWNDTLYIEVMSKENHEIVEHEGVVELEYEKRGRMKYASVTGIDWKGEQPEDFEEIEKYTEDNIMYILEAVEAEE